MLNRLANGVASGLLLAAVSHPMGAAAQDNTCKEAPAAWAQFQVATPDVVERAKRDSGAQIVRVIPPDTSAAQVFQNGRLNLEVDADNVIQSVSCW
jgi:hypothetical protein